MKENRVSLPYHFCDTPILVEELIQPELNELLRHQILSNLFSEWLKKQVALVDIETQLDSAPIHSLVEHAPAATAISG